MNKDEYCYLNEAKGSCRGQFETLIQHLLEALKGLLLFWVPRARVEPCTSRVHPAVNPAQPLLPHHALGTADHCAHKKCLWQQHVITITAHGTGCKIWVILFKFMNPLMMTKLSRNVPDRKTRVSVWHTWLYPSVVGITVHMSRCFTVQPLHSLSFNFTFCKYSNLTPLGLHLQVRTNLT